MSLEPQSTNEEAAPEPSTSRCDTQEPIKGILKRPSLKYENKNEVLPKITHRPSPDRFPDGPATRIPKLSVTWWEKNAVAIFGDTSDENNTDSEHLLKDLGNKATTDQESEQRQTAILDSEDDSENVVLESQDLCDESRDDSMSVASSTGSASSSVVGRWWTGKDTRYVPHCQKRGCNHNHNETPGYLTPTQRRNKEVSDLKNELRTALKERDEKERHLEELRERIKEVEMLNIRQTSLCDSHRLMIKEREAAEAYEREKKLIERRHAIRVNQLVHETLNARDEILRLTARIKELEKIVNVPRVDSETMTDAVQFVPPLSQSPSTLDPVDPNQQKTVLSLPPQPPPSPPSALTTTATTSTSATAAATTTTAATTATTTAVATVPPMPLSPVCSVPEQTSMSTPLLTSPLCVESKVTGQQLYMSQEALNHMQACQNEAFIWRTKAAQLEIVVKDQLAKASRIEEALRAELLAARAEQSQSTSVSTKSIAAGDDINSGTPICVSPVSFECTIPSCLERRRNLIQENDRLTGQTEESSVRIRELEDKLKSARHDLEAVEEHRDRLKHQLEIATKERDSKIAEVAACNIVITRHQSEKDTMQKAIAYMEERMQVYQNTLMEHDLVISDENSADWRRGFVDPRYSVMVSKRIQTTLTAEALSRHEDDFALTKKKLAELHKEFTSDRSDLHERFEEIEKILFTKTQVVDTLSRQLEETCRGQRQQIDAQQEERESYKKKLEEISSVAEKVPILEAHIEQLLKEKSEFDLRFSAQREEMEHALEEALTEALAKYKEQNEYWKSKQAALEQSLDRSKAEIVQHVKEKEDMNMKAKLERADLERRLTSSIEHVAMLVNQMNKTRRDVECEARPRNVSKYVACRPNTKSKSTVIAKGDLFDENEERLKLCQGELATTRRQVHVLQEKLINSMQDKADRRVSVRRRIASITDRESEPQKTDGDNFETLQAKNVELCEQVVSAAEEKATLVRDERKRIRHLADEFENLRRELDQEMNRHEIEKTWLKSRIRNLEVDNEELQYKIETGAEQNGGAVMDVIPIRKAVSEPEFCIDNDETPQLRAENIHLRRELDRVRNSLRRTALVVSRDRSHMSPELATLADDLNLVKSDLEQILSSMDHPTTSGTTSEQITCVSPSPIHVSGAVEDNEELHSDILEAVMIDWEADEKKQLIWDLKRSRQERDIMKSRIERMTHQLNEARAELEVYRREGVVERNTYLHMDLPCIVRSSSTSNLNDNVTNKDEVRMWKEKCSTMFRELNSMRSGYQRAQDERRELKIQLAMLRGELEMERCHGKKDVDLSVVPSAGFLPRSRSCHSSNEVRREARSTIVHEKHSPFKSGSIHESTVYHITAMKPLVVKRIRRARSEQRKSTTSSIQKFEPEESAQSARTIQPSALSSSTTLTKDDTSVGSCSVKPGLLLSQSWHEYNGQRMVSRVETNYSRPRMNQRESHLMSMRERIDQLSRENRMPQEQGAASKAKINATKSSTNRLDVDQISRLRQEKEALQMKIDLLLVKCEQESTSAKHALSEMNAQLELSRNENAMYAKKLHDMEEERREMYLVMFKKGQQAAAMDMKEVAQVDQMTQDRVVLRFLHDAFYYYLVDKGNAKEHLQAIMTMLNFSMEQKDEVARKKSRSH